SRSARSLISTKYAERSVDGMGRPSARWHFSRARLIQRCAVRDQWPGVQRMALPTFLSERPIRAAEPAFRGPEGTRDGSQAAAVVVLVLPPRKAGLRALKRASRLTT